MSLVEAEELKKVTVHHLKRFGFLQGDYGYKTSTLTFNISGEPTGTILAKFDYDKQGQLYKMTLSYSMVNTGTSIETPIRVDTMPCNYGGIRWIFKCPNCYKNCYKLYLLSKYFRCRVCHNLTYESNNQSKNWRYLNKTFGILFEDSTPAYRKAHRYPTYKGRPTRNYIKVENRYSNIDIDSLNNKMEAMLKV